MKINCIIEVPFDVYITVERDKLPNTKLELLQSITNDELNAGTIGRTPNEGPVDYYDRTDGIRHAWMNAMNAIAGEDQIDVTDWEYDEIQFTGN